MQRAVAAIEVSCGYPVILETFATEPVGKLPPPPNTCDPSRLTAYLEESFEHTCAFVAEIQLRGRYPFIEVRPGEPSSSGCKPRRTPLDSALALGPGDSQDALADALASHGVQYVGWYRMFRDFDLYPEKTLRQVLRGYTTIRNSRWQTYSVVHTSSGIAVYPHDVGGPYREFDTESGPFSHRHLDSVPFDDVPVIQREARRVRSGRQEMEDFLEFVESRKH